MKRLSVLTFLSVLLCACAEPPKLPQQEVLERAVLASQRLQSASFALHVDGTYVSATSGREIFPDITIDGMFEQGGDMLSAVADAMFEWKGEDDTDNSLRVKGAVSVLAQDELYLRLDTIDAKPEITEESPLHQLSPLLGNWFLFPHAPQDSVQIADITPDPQLLKEQASLVTVTQDHGFEHVSGRYAYHYSVKLDKEKFLKMFPPEEAGKPNDAAFDAQGELWIDAENFYVRKAEWSVATVPFFEGELQGTFSLELTDHDLPVTVSAPENPVIFDPTALPFSQDEETP